MDVSLEIMYQTSLLGFFKIFSSMTAFLIFAFSVQKRGHLLAFKYLKFVALALGLWDLLEGIFYLTPNTNLLPFIALLFYIVIPFTSLSFFFFCFTYVFPNSERLMKKFFWLFIIPGITLVMIACPPLHKFFIIFPGDVIFHPLRDTTRLYQPWFYVFYAQCGLLIVVGAGLLLFRIFRPGNNNPIKCMLIGLSAMAFLGVNAYNVFFDSDKILFIFPLLTVICLNTFYWTLFFDETEKTIYSSQGELVDTLKFPVIVINKKNFIIYMNQEAQNNTTMKIGQKIAPEKYRESFPDFIPHQFDLDNFSHNDFISTNIILTHKSTGFSYYLHDHVIHSANKKQSEMGRMIILITISVFNTFFHELEQKAFTDHHSGCYNRHFFALKSQEFQNQEALPLSCIICDLDNLKLVNDTLGHGEGDVYITSCVKHISSSIRKNDLVFRIGGDEFLVLLPNTPEKIVQDIAQNIQEKSTEVTKNYSFPTGISVGYSSIETFPFSIEKLIVDADQSMYQNKKKRKSAQ